MKCRVILYTELTFWQSLKWNERKWDQILFRAISIILH